MDIYKNKHLHPGFDNLIKAHYADFYDSVYIAFLPFFKMANNDRTNQSFQQPRQITFNQAQQTIEIFKGVPDPGASLYSYKNDNYPKDNTILENGTAVSWEEIRIGCRFEGIADINKALRTSIGAYKKVFARADLASRLLEYAGVNQIFIPTEGHFDVLSKIKILKAFRMLGKTEIVVEDEFHEKRMDLDISDISDISEQRFVEAIGFKDYFIYDKEKEILFAVGWDDFFFFVCSGAENLEKITRDLGFEGFYCDDTTEASWELTKEEMAKGLENELTKAWTIEIEAKKPWWKLW